MATGRPLAAKPTVGISLDGYRTTAGRYVMMDDDNTGLAMLDPHGFVEEIISDAVQEGPQSDE